MSPNEKMLELIIKCKEDCLLASQGHHQEIASIRVISNLTQSENWLRFLTGTPFLFEPIVSVPIAELTDTQQSRFKAIQERIKEGLNNFDATVLQEEAINEQLNSEKETKFVQALDADLGYEVKTPEISANNPIVPQISAENDIQTTAKTIKAAKNR